MEHTIISWQQSLYLWTIRRRSGKASCKADVVMPTSLSGFFWQERQLRGQSNYQLAIIVRIIIISWQQKLYVWTIRRQSGKASCKADVVMPTSLSGCCSFFWEMWIPQHCESLTSGSWEFEVIISWQQLLYTWTIGQQSQSRGRRCGANNKSLCQRDSSTGGL